MNSINENVRSLCLAARGALPSLAAATDKQKNNALMTIASALRHNAEKIIEENKKDLRAAEANGVAVHMLDRLSLSVARIESIASAIEEVAALPSPIGSGSVSVRPNGLSIKHTKVPIGVVGMIYEARPNVTADAAALCLKTGNSVVLRGGKEAINTNIAIVSVITESLESCGISPDAVKLINSTERESSTALMQMRGYIDLLIPRGGKGLIKSVVENATVPVIETGAGNCHMYIDSSADIDLGVRVAVNAKTSRPSVCNAIETLLVHSSAAAEFLPKFREATRDFALEIRGCERTRAILSDALPATEEDYDTEYDDMIIAVRVVDSLEEAIEHIRKYSTGHSEAIITNDLRASEKFTSAIDSAALYVNASTRFTDGGEFGLGAEIGISTQKLHVRGPMGLEALTTDKYIIVGEGQVR